MKNQNIVKGVAAAGLLLAIGSLSSNAVAAKYKIDPGHSFIEFSILHLGYSVMKGRFNKLSGGFEYDSANPGSSSIQVEVETASVDTNHAERDKHLRSKDFLEVKTHSMASFKSTGFKPDGDGAMLQGDLTIHGVTRSVSMAVVKIGEGKDPWGGYRAGFKGTLDLKRSDFGMDHNLGPKSDGFELAVFIEGIRE
ncbi:MAG: YceI family protein [Candidatus Sedimenticola sp. PURPLELP]